MRRIAAIVRKETLQMLRQKQVLALLFVVPVVQLIIFGYAITTDIKNLDVAICDLDHSPTSREIAEKIAHSKYFNPPSFFSHPAQSEDILKHRKADALLLIPSGFERKLLRGERTGLLLVLNGMDSNTASIAAGYLSRLLYDFFKRRAARPLLQMRYSAWFNQELKSAYYMVPGIVGIIVTIVSTLLIGFSIVREKVTASLEQIILTPLRPYEFLLGKVIPYAIAGFLSLNLSLAVGKYWFSVPMRGSYSLLLLSSFLYIFTALGIGVLISTFSTTFFQVLFFSWFTLLFELLLSGVLIPIRNMPEGIQLLSNLNPLRFYAHILRVIFLKGAGFNVIAKDLAALLLFAAVSLFLSSSAFLKMARKY